MTAWTAREAVTLQSDALPGYFSDATNAYRFRAAKYDVVTARLLGADTSEMISEGFHFPTGERRLILQGDGGIFRATLDALNWTDQICARHKFE